LQKILLQAALDFTRARYAEFRARKMLRANMGRDSRTNNLINSYAYLLFLAMASLTLFSQKKP
jgi:hypothetical protein